MIDKYFHIHTVAFQSQDMQYECCVLKGVYYTQLNSTQPEITDAGVWHLYVRIINNKTIL